MREIYTAAKNFTLPPALTAWTNSTSGLRLQLVHAIHGVVDQPNGGNEPSVPGIERPKKEANKRQSCWKSIIYNTYCMYCMLGETSRLGLFLQVVVPSHHIHHKRSQLMLSSAWQPFYLTKHCKRHNRSKGCADLRFVKKFTRPKISQ